MIISPGFVGIDISKSDLDVFDGTLGHGERIANAGAPIAALVARLRDQGSLVLFEATGSYDRLLREALAAAGIPFARVNPARARDFARAAGYLAKTDAVDAAMLAAMAQALRPATVEPGSPDRDHLTRLHRRRDQLVAMRRQERARFSEAPTTEERDDIAPHIVWLSAEITRYDKKIAALIHAVAAFKETWQRLRSVPGIGPVAATTLIARLPELGRRSRKTIGALAGLAPLNRDSGQFRGKRHIAPGRKRIRDALYMAALAARRSCPRFKNAYDTMIANGKPPKVALIALARKLLVILNAIERDKIAFSQ
jgi:transposase